MTHNSKTGELRVGGGLFHFHFRPSNRFFGKWKDWFENCVYWFYNNIILCNTNFSQFVLESNQVINMWGGFSFLAKIHVFSLKILKLLRFCVIHHLLNTDRSNIPYRHSFIFFMDFKGLKTSPEPGYKLQMGYKSIMRTDEWGTRPRVDV